MTELDVLLTPEMEALLRELAARPRSLFLRADRRAAFRAVRSRTEEPISAIAVSDALERELVSVYRAELAEILRQACRTRLLEGEREKLFIMRYRSTNERVDPVPLARVRERLGQATRAGADEPWAGAIAAIQQALAPEDPEQVSVLDLAAIGQRLVPGDTWRISSAIWLMIHDRHDSAAALAHSVLDGWPEREYALRACEIIAGTYTHALEYGRALALQLATSAEHGDYPLGLINALSLAIQCGDEAAALASSRRLDMTLSVADDIVTASSEALGRQRSVGDWRPTKASMHVVRQLNSSLGPVARRLSDEFL